MIFVAIKNARLKLALTIPAGTPITVANDVIETPPVFIDKKKKKKMNCQNNQRKQHIY